MKGARHRAHGTKSQPIREYKIHLPYNVLPCTVYCSPFTVHQLIGGKNGGSQEDRDWDFDDCPYIRRGWCSLGPVSWQLAPDYWLDHSHGSLLRCDHHGKTVEVLRLPDFNNLVIL